MDTPTADSDVRSRAQELHRQFDWETTCGLTGAQYAAHMDAISQDLRARPIDVPTLECLLALEREKAVAEYKAQQLTDKNFSRLSSTPQERGRAGGKARGEKYAPLREKAMELASAGGYPNALAAGKAIKSDILALAAELRVPLTEDQASERIAEWLRAQAFDLL